MVWDELKSLYFRSYQLTPLKPQLEAQVEQLRREISSDREVTLSNHRKDFYELVTESGWYLLHLRHAGRTIYLVAYAPIRPIEATKTHRTWVGASRSTEVGV